MTQYVLAAAIDWNTVMTVVKALPLAFLILGALIGFATGVRKMPRGGIAWMIAANVYSLLLSVLQPTLGEEQPVVPVLVGVIACAISAVLFYIISKFLFYPYDKEITSSGIKKILEKEDRFRRAEAEEMEELEKTLDADEDDFERLERQQMKRRQRYFDRMDGKPSLLGRLVGALVVGVDTVFVLRIVIDIVVLIISGTPLSTGVLAPLCELEAYRDVLAFAEKTALDYLIIGAFMFSIKKGYENGVLNATYSLISSVASMGACVLGFYIPFSPWVAEGGLLAFTGKIVNGVVAIVQPMVAGSIPFAIPDVVYQAVGKICAGLIYTVVLLIAAKLLTNLIQKFADISYESSVFHFFDGVVGIIVGIVTCVIVIAGIFFVLLLMERFGWYSSAATLFEGTRIFEVLYSEFANFAGGWADKIYDFLPFGK